MSHCTCCYPACPVPVLECETKHFNLTFLSGFQAFTRYATNPDGSQGAQQPDLFPASCQRYSKQVESLGWSTPMSYSQTSLTGDPDEYVTFTKSESGTVTLTKIRTHVGCHAYEETVEGAGSMSFESKDYVRYYDDDTSSYKTWLKEHITREWTYVGGTTIANPDAGDPGEPATIAVPHGSGAFLRTDTTIIVSTPGGSSTTTTDKWLTSFSSVSNYGDMPPTAFDTHITQTHTLRKKEHTVDYSGTASVTASGVLVDSTERSEPWTETKIRDDLQACLDAMDWEPGACKAEYAVTYNQKPKLDIHGDPVTEDHDDDPATPEVPVYEDETGCVDEMEMRQWRYRFVIPHDFDPPPEPHPQKWHGIWHKLEWQEIFTPADHDPEAPLVSPKVVTAKSGEWTGPGDELETYEDWNTLTDEQKKTRRESWKTPWTEIDVPETQGTTTLKLIRSQCYHGAPWAYH